MEEKTIIYQDAKIHYRVTGSGKTVILLHGFAEDGDVWRYQLPALQNNCRLIIPDIPGSGRSGLIAGANIETYAEVIKTILDKELVTVLPASQTQPRVTIIGHSLGGYITLAFAEKYPNHLRQFGLFHSTAFADSDDKKAARRKSIDFIHSNGGAAFLKTSITGLFTKAFAEKNPGAVASLIERGNQFSSEALVQYYNAMITRPDRGFVLQNFTGPVLFIMGEYDNAVPLQSGLRQCYFPRQSHVHILKNSAHMGMWEEPLLSNEILSRFLETE